MHINNIEFKIRIDDAAAMRAAIEAVADGPPETLHQKDTYFNAGDSAYLKLREENDRASLIAYRRARRAEPRPSDIRLTRIDNPGDLAETLAHALGTLAVVDKTRDLYFRGQTRIHLDRVAGLGDFVELEVVLQPGQDEAGGTAIADDLIDRLGLDRNAIETDSYRDLLAYASDG
ncbi:MAG: class IV adenylate cyclase [Wenzhouxiangellaceae bacterium]|nr:class IV adenylate cyclase [Wenzhouxiangellaceae bacterium]